MPEAEYSNIERQQTYTLPYTQDYLKEQIGKRVLVSFLLGTSTYRIMRGILENVGIDYVILKEDDGNLLLGDLYAIKFVTMY